MLSTALSRPSPGRRRLSLLLLSRQMGGGPRTFPGGLNKWQWKRLHEKKAREKEKRLLDQEKQLYHARLRSHIRATLNPNTVPEPDPAHKPISPKEHIKALADRFVRPGAEDLWNDNDGPAAQKPQPHGPGPIDLRETVGDGSSNGFPGDSVQKRGFSSNGGFDDSGLMSNMRPIDLRKLVGEFTGNSRDSLMGQEGPDGDVRRVVGDGRSNGFSGNWVQKRGFSSNIGFDDSGLLSNLRTFLPNTRFIGGPNTDPMRPEDLPGDLKRVVGDGRLKGFAGNWVEKREFLSNVGVNEGMNVSNLRAFSPNTSFVIGENVSNLRVFLPNTSVITSGNVSNLRGFSSGVGFNDRGLLSTLRAFSSNTSFIVGGNVSNLGSFCRNSRQQERGYSAATRTAKGGFGKRVRRRWNDGSSSDDEDDEGVYGRVGENARWPRFSLGGGESDHEEMGERGDGKSVRVVKGNNAALGKYDVKITRRRRILKELEDYAEQECEEEVEGDLSERIEKIRQEVNERKLVEREKSQEQIERGEDDFVISGKRFEDCGISPMTVRALTSAGYVLMTRVQEATLSIGLEGKDALVKARSGTGKTAAFLLPAIETVLKAMSSDKGKQRVPPIYVLILCPTRELASQIAAEARVMLKYHDGLGVQMLVGGTRFKDDLKRLESDFCQFLVATPGRLLDHIESRSGLSVRLMGLKMLVLDEADRLLDLGFRKDIEKIVDCLPNRRQSLLFSATIPKEVRRVSQLVLKREHEFINTVDAGCSETSSKVKQSYIIAPHDEHFQIVHRLLEEHISQTPDYKVIVFCATGMVTSLMYLLFRELKLNVREIHSRKPQLYRSRIVDEFKLSKRLILISSDVSTRGMNYPDVTLVIQVGIPLDRGQYMHRLGRTGREGKSGEGILLLAPWEEQFLDDIRDLPVERSSAPPLSQDMKLKMEDSMAKIDTSVKEAAYHAWLGYYNSLSEIGRDKTSLVNRANEFGESIGLQTPPALFRKTVTKMGLKGIPGIRIRK